MTTTSFLDSPWVSGLGGLSHGSMFRISDTVDTSQPPGSAAAKSLAPEPWRDTFRKIATFESFVYSPNLPWFLMASVVWHFFPYPKVISSVSFSIAFSWQQFLQDRLLLNTILAFGYVGFWHVTLYGFRWCHRPFVPDRVYSRQRVVHNAFYTMWGILHWTLVETAFVYCYQTGRLVLDGGGKATNSTSDFLIMMALAMWTPSFRDVHFYLAHRMIHIRWLYKYVHSLHHRNIDVEPFSGLAMHPVEHLYYYTCYAPWLLPILSRQPYAPFLVFWMNFHTALSPAAAHSGWEDHFSADLIHYLHHRYCDCNYAAAINFDALFRTYQPCIKGSGNDEKESPKGQILDPSKNPKATLEEWWRPENAEYQFGVMALVVATIWAHSKSLLSPLASAFLLTVGPTVLAFGLAMTNRRSSLPWRKALLAPFDKDPMWSLILHFGMGTILGVLPSTYLVYLVLSDP